MKSDFLQFPFVCSQFFNFISHVWLNYFARFCFNCFARINYFARNYTLILIIFVLRSLTIFLRIFLYPILFTISIDVNVCNVF